MRSHSSHEICLPFEAKNVSGESLPPCPQRSHHVWTSVARGGGVLVAQGLPVDRIGDLAFENAIRLHELAPAQASLEEAFMELTADSVEFQAHTPGQQDAGRDSRTDRMHPTGVA